MFPDFETSISDVYGTDSPDIPEGYEAAGFDLPSEDEYYLSNCNTVMSGRNPYPRIILYKKQEVA